MKTNPGRDMLRMSMDARSASLPEQPHPSVAVLESFVFAPRCGKFHGIALGVADEQPTLGRENFWQRRFVQQPLRPAFGELAWCGLFTVGRIGHDEVKRATGLGQLPHRPQRIGHAQTALPQPPQHPSYAWIQIPAWQAVIDSIDAEQISDGDIELIARLTQALYFGGHPEQAIVTGARLFEINPQHAITALAFLPSIDSLWQTFHDGDDPHPPSHFPAWLLLHRPGLIHHLRSDYPTPRSEPFQACAQLLRKRLENADEIAAREQLQAISPGLLRVYFGLNVAA